MRKLNMDNPPPTPSQEGKEMNPLDIQVGGDHYKGFAIQPVEFISKNNLSFLQGCIIKRIARYNRHGGKGLQDLEKCKHEIDLIIKLEKFIPGD